MYDEDRGISEKEIGMIKSALQELAEGCINDPEKEADVNITVKDGKANINVTGDIRGIVFCLGYFAFTVSDRTGLSPAAVACLTESLRGIFESACNDGKISDCSKDGASDDDAGSGSEAPGPDIKVQEHIEGIDDSLWE